MKQKFFLSFIFCTALSCGFFSLHAEDLEFLFTSTALYDGGPGLTGGTAYTMPSGTNTYVGWIWFPHGFTIDSGSTSGLRIIPPVDGTINLNDGTLTMTGDVILASGGLIGGDGNVDGQGHALRLSDQLSLNSTLTFISDTIIDGGNNDLILGANAQLWVSNNTTVSLQNMIIKDLNSLVNNKIVMAGAGSKLALDNVTIWLDDDYSFTQGSLFFYNDVIIAGSSHSFIYQSAQQSYITKQAQLKIDHGVTFNYDSLAKTHIVMNDNTSHLYLNGCTLYENNSGLELTNGTVLFDSLTTLSATEINLGTASNSLTTIILPGANIQVYGHIAVDEKMYLQGTQSHFIFMEDGAQVTLNNDVDAFCNKILVQDSNNAITAGVYGQTDAGSFGCERLATLESQMATIDHGPGDIDVNTTTTSLLYDLWLSKHHKLNVDTSAAGGDVTFDGATHFIHFARETAEPSGADPVLLVSGGNEIEFTNVVFKDFSPDYIDLQGGSTILFGDGTTIEMSNNELASTNYTMSFNGKVRINCFGNEFDLSQNARALDVLPSSTLIIQNARISGLDGNNLRCIAPDTSLTLSNCTLVLESNYSFTQGHLNLYQSVALEGLDIFAYQSPQPLTIHPDTQFTVDLGVTLSYDSVTAPALVDNSSRFALTGCTLHVTTTGLQLTKGMLIVDHIVSFEGESNSSNGAITFGDGTEANNLTIEIMPGGTIEVDYGYLSYKNTA